MSDFDKHNDFWDVSKLVPRKKGTLSHFASSDPTRRIVIDSKEQDGQEPVEKAEFKLSLDVNRGVKAKEEFTYYPVGNGFIKSVTVTKFTDKYDFYDNFRKSALLYFDCKNDVCDFVQFYSFMPQYSQMNKEQKCYYFYWRDQFRRGKYVKTDYSYVYLFVYEVLNLPDKIPPAEGLGLLCRLWREYRGVLPRLDYYFSMWVQDYCLVHQLDCPTDELSDFLFQVIAVASFKEFYLCDIDRAGSGGINAMLAYLSDYDWRRGKYAQGFEGDSEERRRQVRVAYKTHIEGAMGLLLRDLWHTLLGEGRLGRTETVRRASFPNSLCTHSVKSQLEIVYYPISNAAELRRGVSAAVRYTENKIRALLGVKSRLTVRFLPDDYRRVIDYYFKAVFDREERCRAKENKPEYEKLYDAPTETLSVIGADEIERISWDTTVRLVTVEEPCTDVCELPCTETQPESIIIESEVCTEEPDSYGLSTEDVDFIYTLCGRDSSFAVGNVDFDSAAERVNEAFADRFGDVIIEPAPEGYRIIPDYLEEVEEWVMKIRR